MEEPAPPPPAPPVNPVYKYNVLRDIYHHQVRCNIHFIWVRVDRHKDGDVSDHFEPSSIQVINDDNIGFYATGVATVDGKPFTVEDMHGIKSDDKKVTESNITAVSIPNVFARQTLGRVEFRFGFSSNFLPTVSMFEFTVTLVSNNPIFDPKWLKTISVRLNKDIKLKLVGQLLNLNPTVPVTRTNWIQIKFFQLIDILDPTVKIRFTTIFDEVAEAGPDWQLSGSYIDCTVIVSWVNSVAHFFGIEGGGCSRTPIAASDDDSSSSIETVSSDSLTSRYASCLTLVDREL
uniref:Uncharacterized protein n=1 Tax=Atrato Sobemo-like virus 5 TaxID=2689351 RepID=A0A6B9KU68_9VIRU|nr:hypothetical protein [Atrato Sobemo-like virus 5]